MSERSVAIVGRAKPTFDLVPFDDERLDIWGYHDHAFRGIKRLTAMFEMHPDCLDAERYQDDYKAWLMQPHEFPILMHCEDERIPNSVQYPIEKIRTTFGSHLWKGEKKIEDFYTSTTPYALALALYMGYRRIELYGIELIDNQFRKQGDSIFYWLGRADQMGVDVVIHPESLLYENSLYPFERRSR